MKPILEVRDISKKFNIRGQVKPYLSIRESMFSFLNPSSKNEEFWALKGINFEVMPGDTIGIIGKNGAGKSTLLKILSKITPPTSGKIICRGRIASLLEVGTGFHPELSGRENIFLNGSILGMKRAEIKKQLDAIVDFSGVEKFLETPLKHYSSGMQLRLAFAVAAFLEPELLVIDEVLAVGDSEFQRKCIRKMEDVSKSGRTILFVSHNMSSLQAICKKGLLLSNGLSKGISPIEETVRLYTHGEDTLQHSLFKIKNIPVHKEAYILEARLMNENGELCKRFKSYENIHLEITWVNKNARLISPNFMLVNQKNQTVMVALDTPADWRGDKKSQAGKYRSRFVIPKNLLNADDYLINLALDCSSPTNCYDAHLGALLFSVWDPMDEHSIARGNFSLVREDAVLMPALDCSFTYLGEEET
jgi:lipopolysaccharide transport system ATP-binding protein